MPSSFRQRLLAGRPAHGAFLFLGSADVAEVMALAGYDFLIVDREHVAAGPDAALAALRAIRSVNPDIAVLVRLNAVTPGEVKPLLDAGFDGLIAADLRSVDAARALVQAAHYPPLGRRGAQFTVSRAARFGLDPDPVARARAGTLLIASIESRAGLEAIADIAAVEGMDGLFIGPLDLTADYGRFGDLTHPDLAHSIARAEALIRASGRLLCGPTLPGQAVPALIARGYGLVTSACDTVLLRDAARAAVAAAQSMNERAPGHD